MSVPASPARTSARACATCSPTALGRAGRGRRARAVGRRSRRPGGGTDPPARRGPRGRPPGHRPLDHRQRRRPRPPQPRGPRRASSSARGRRVIVHVTCRDRNRSELLSLGWRLAQRRDRGPARPDRRLHEPRAISAWPSPSSTSTRWRCSPSTTGSTAGSAARSWPARSPATRDRDIEELAPARNYRRPGADRLLPRRRGQPVQGRRARPGPAVPQAREQGPHRRPLRDHPGRLGHAQARRAAALGRRPRGRRSRCSPTSSSSRARRPGS